MNTNTLITRTTVTFVTLAIAGILMAVGAKTLANTVDQIILIAIGSALFGAALSFFLVRVFSLAEK
jgi:NhaP-type Na+/H+ or K+/H+ antiporter